jgi:predicted nuclease of predicted toxin-antitoxin system
VKFLVDNQLPVALARWLSAQGHEARHVLELGLEETSDKEIWRQAVVEDYVVVSKDEDFFHLATRATQGKLVWVRRPNCRKQALLAAFASALPAVEQAIHDGHRIVQLT